MGLDYFFKGVTFGYYARNGYFSSEAARCEAETASMRPYFWNSGKKYDGEEQANYLAAVIRAFSAGRAALVEVGRAELPSAVPR